VRELKKPTTKIMILQRLNELYDRLVSDGEDIARKGWSSKAISFRVIIDREGKLQAIQDAASYEGKKRIMPKMITPGDVSLGSAVLPEYFNGSAEYLLGFDPKGKGKTERTQEMHEAFKALHDELKQHCELKQQPLPDLSADQLTNDQKALLTEIGGRGVIYLAGEPEPMFNHPEFVEWYNARQLAPDEEYVEGQCLITGEMGPLARTHEPAIKGVVETAISGAKIGGSNAPNFDSYGKTSGLNSPVSLLGAFKYTTALNHLLRTGSLQKVNLSGISYAFWAKRHDPIEEVIGGAFGDLSGDKEHGAIQKLKKYLASARELKASAIEFEPDDQPFYLLGLHGARSRISIRTFLESSTGHIRENLERYFQETAIVGLENPLSLKRILSLTVRDPKEVENSQAAFLLEAILTGHPYPESLAQKIVQRWKVDHGEYARFSDPSRAAILKAYLTRNHNRTMSNELNTTNQSTAYRLGRAFATLERLQKESNKKQGTEAGIRHQFLSSAVTTPSRVFPLLLKRHSLWIKNLEDQVQSFYSNALSEILGDDSITSFPTRLSLEDQGMFFVGYYHQHQIFRPKGDKGRNEDGDQ
jgi:CRISPR-associated protein Csd1